jgi:superfamily II DNA or RNA helicase
VLGTSATPIRYLDNERDMSDEIFEGNIAVNLSLAEAIVKGILPMPKYISALYDFEEESKNLIHKVVNSKNTEEEKVELIKQIEVMKNQLNKSKGIPKILQKHLDQTKSNGKFIVFCKNKEHLNEMKDVVVNWFKKAKINNKIQTYIIYTGYENTDIEFQNFRDNKDGNTLKLLFSIEMLNEGIHVEDITGVILLRPTISPIIYYQQIGRAIDAGSEEKPLIFDFVNNFDNIGAKKFINDLNEYREKEINKKKENDESDKKDIFEFIIFDEVLEIKKLFNNIENRLIDNWDVMYEKLKSLFIDNNSVYLKDKDRVLYNWICIQRLYYKKGLLNGKKIEMLNKLDFVWNEREANWNFMYKQLHDYFAKNGHTEIYKDKNIKDKKFINWVSTQRTKYINNLLDSEKIDLMNNLNFTWNKFDESWDLMYMLLKEYFKENDNHLVDARLIYKEKGLGHWVATQRDNYKKEILKQSKIDKLNEIDFVWNVIEDQWDLMYNSLVNFVNKNDHSNIPKDYIIDGGGNLKIWVNNQKRLIKLGKMSDDRKNKLVDFLWCKVKDKNVSDYHIKNLLINGKVDSKTLSKILDVSIATISFWRVSKMNIPKKHIFKIAEIFNIEPHLLQPQKGDKCVKENPIK